jgi:hypothetical protein
LAGKKVKNGRNPEVMNGAMNERPPPQTPELMNEDMNFITSTALIFHAVEMGLLPLSFSLLG